MNRIVAFAYRRFSLTLLVCIIAGCSTAGVKFDTSNVTKIAKGTTTKTDILGYFGKPARTEVAPNGEVWTYVYVESHTTGAGVLGHVTVGVDQSETIANTLTLVFDGEIVKDYRFENGSHTDTYMPFH